MTQLRYYDGQAHVTATEEDPYPVRVMSDVQSRNVTGRTGQVSVATTATLIVPANASRRSLKLTQITGTQIVYIGFTPAVSSTTGDYFSNVAGSTMTIYAKGAMYGIAASSAQTVSWMEEEYADS